MKELTKKILESGLVEKTIGQLLSRWGMLTSEEYSTITQKQIIAETLELFIEDLEILMQPESIERKEIILDSICDNCGCPDPGDEHWIWPTMDPESIAAPGFKCKKTLKGI